MTHTVMGLVGKRVRAHDDVHDCDLEGVVKDGFEERGRRDGRSEVRILNELPGPLQGELVSVAVERVELVE